MRGLPVRWAAAPLLLAGCGVGGAGGSAEPEAVAAAAIEGAPAIGRVWPGWWDPYEPFIVYRPGDVALLVSPEEPPGGWVAAPAGDVPPSLHGRAWLRRGAVPGLSGGIATDFRVGDLRAVAVPVDGTFRQVLVTLLHESFHAYQDGAFAPRAARGEDVPASTFATPEYVATAEVERRVLLEALDAPDSALPRLAREYLSLRHARRSGLADRPRLVELEIERHEGSAELVGYQGAAAALALEPERTTRAIAAVLARSPAVVGGGVMERLIRWRVYGTGAAQGLLLDRLGASWRERLQEGAYFPDLLAVAVGFEPAGAGTLAAAARERHGYASLVGRGRELWGGLEDVTAESFFAGAAGRLVLVVRDPSELGVAMSFSGEGGHAVGDLTLLRAPDPFTLRGEGLVLEVAGLPVAIDRGGMPARGRVVVLLERAPSADQVRHRDGGVEIRLDGIRLEARAATGAVAGDSIVVTVGPPG